jgi:hypothetical protein
MCAFCIPMVLIGTFYRGALFLVFSPIVGALLAAPVFRSALFM